MTDETLEKAKKLKEDIEHIKKAIKIVEENESLAVDPKEQDTDGGYTRYKTCAFYITGSVREAFLSSLNEECAYLQSKFAEL